MILKNIFGEKFGENIGVFVQTTASFCKNLIIAFVFEKNANFLRRKMAKNAENYDRNIDPLVTLSPTCRLNE
jgi:hypothetical protein